MCAAVGRIDGKLLAGSAGDDARDRLSVARPEKGGDALRGGSAEVGNGELDALGDLPADGCGHALEGLLHRLAAVDAFGGGGRELLGLVL